MTLTQRLVGVKANLSRHAIRRWVLFGAVGISLVAFRAWEGTKVHDAGSARPVVYALDSPLTFVEPNLMLFGVSRTWVQPGIKRDRVLSWGNPTIAVGLKKLGFGGTKWPGGTEAQCWNWSSNINNYIGGCMHGFYDWRKRLVAAQSPNAWSITQWLHDFKGTEAFSDPNSPSYTFNVISSNAATGRLLMQSLHDQLDKIGETPRFIELGNELYFKMFHVSPRAYLEQIAPAVRKARQLWPGVKMALVGDMISQVRGSDLGTTGRWMTDLGVAFQSWPERDFITAVSYHDYTLRPRSLVAERPVFEEAKYATVVAAWPHASVQLGKQTIKTSFGRPLIQWQTESGIGFFGFQHKTPPQHEKEAYDFLLNKVRGGVIHAQFSLSFILTGIEEGFDMYMYPCAFSITAEEIVGCGPDHGGLIDIGENVTRCSGTGQILAHVAWAAQTRVTKWAYLPPSKETLPDRLLGFVIPCIQGAGFFGEDVTRFVFSNRCQRELEYWLHVPQQGRIGSEHWEAHTYALENDAPNVVVACGPTGEFPWQGPVLPRTTHGQLDGALMKLQLPAHSIVIVHMSEP
eukprot:TRINITY_DN6863_c0_g1_i1.p1 TRINITY_DN6863_c0_g1~~TRINITY_DN6863_c0_g1_i1.p1  ORF type:complete len:573 (-),score=55.21 TRINITY_DN6863_c0_g1_i1:103-1821(-)